MTSPIIISDLDPANPIDAANDLLLIRQGLNDRKATVDQVAGIRLTPLSMLPDYLQPDDVLLIGRNVGGVYENYIMPPQYLGFLNGTNCWFYQAAAPLGWTIIAGTGDRLLGVSDASGNLYDGQAAPAQAGDWQQTGWALTLTQMPYHGHQIPSNEREGTSPTYVCSGRTFDGEVKRLSTYGTGGNPSLGNATDPHNHGNTWRPLANVGVLCTKDKNVGA